MKVRPDPLERFASATLLQINARLGAVEKALRNVSRWLGFIAAELGVLLAAFGLR